MSVIVDGKALYQAAAFEADGLAGATAVGRFAGATSSGAPTSGSWDTGDLVIDQSGTLQICTAGGAPGTWTGPKATAGTAPFTLSGVVTAIGDSALTINPTMPNPTNGQGLLIMGTYNGGAGLNRAMDVGGNVGATANNVLLQGSRIAPTLNGSNNTGVQAEVLRIQGNSDGTSWKSFAMLALETTNLPSGTASGAGSAALFIGLDSALPTAGGPTVLYLAPRSTGVAYTAEVVAGLSEAAMTLTIGGAITTQRFNLFTAPTITAGSALTVTNAATLAITGAPAAGGSAVITNAYALWVQAGASRFDGPTTIGGALTATGNASIQGGTVTLSGPNAAFVSTDTNQVAPGGRFQIYNQADILRVFRTTTGDIMQFSGATGTVSMVKAGFFPAQDSGAAQTACGLWAGTGAPSNANGANGDIYLRGDGGAGTTIYQKRAGAWTGIV